MAIHPIPIVLIGARPSLVPTRQPRANVPMMLLMAREFAASVVVLHLPLRFAVSETARATATAPLRPPAVLQADTAAVGPATSVAPTVIAATATPAAPITPVSA